MKIFLMVTLLIMSTATWAKGHNFMLTNRPIKVGTGIKVISNSLGLGILFGWRFVKYNSKQFYMGGAAYTGELTDGTKTGTFTYGGVLFGKDTPLGERTVLDFGILAGACGGQVDTKSAGGVLLEPKVAIDYYLGNIIKLNTGIGYLYIPQSSDFTSISVGVRVDFLF